MTTHAAPLPFPSSLSPNATVQKNTNNNNNNNGNSLIPACPITLEPIEDPVIVDCACSGCVGRRAFEQWIRSCQQLPSRSSGRHQMRQTVNCPCCGAPLRSTAFKPNVLLVRMMETVTAERTAETAVPKESKSTLPSPTLHSPESNSDTNGAENRVVSMMPSTNEESTVTTALPQNMAAPLSPPASSWDRPADYPFTNLDVPSCIRYSLKSTLTGHFHTISCCAVKQHPSGLPLVFSAGRQTVKQWNGYTGAVMRCWKDSRMSGGGVIASTTTATTLCCTLLERGRRLVTADRNGTIRLWTVATGELERHWTLKTSSRLVEIQCLAAVSGKSNKLVSGDSGGDLRLWNADTGQILREFHHRSGNNNSNNSNNGHAQDGQQHAVLCCVVLPPSDDNNNQTHPTHQTMVSGSHDHTLRHWNMATGECLQIWSGHTGPVSCVAICGEHGKRLVSGSHDGTLRVWNWRTGHCERVLKQDDKPMTCCAAVDDRRIVVGSRDDLRLWDVAAGRVDQILQVDRRWRKLRRGGKCSDITCLAATENVIVGGRADKTLQVWTADHFEMYETVLPY